jgi:hypothetical protein
MSTGEEAMRNLQDICEDLIIAKDDLRFCELSDIPTGFDARVESLVTLTRIRAKIHDLNNELNAWIVDPERKEGTNK